MPIAPRLCGSIADLLMLALISENLQQTISGHQSYPPIVPPHTQEVRFVVLLLDEGESVRVCSCLCVCLCTCVCASIGALCAEVKGSRRNPVPESERKRLIAAERGAAQENTWENKQSLEEERGRRGRGEEG